MRKQFLFGECVWVSKEVSVFLSNLDSVQACVHTVELTRDHSNPSQATPCKARWRAETVFFFLLYIIFWRANVLFCFGYKSGSSVARVASKRELVPCAPVSLQDGFWRVVLNFPREVLRLEGFFCVLCVRKGIFVFPCSNIPGECAVMGAGSLGKTRLFIQCFRTEQMNLFIIIVLYHSCRPTAQSSSWGAFRVLVTPLLCFCHCM